MPERNAPDTTASGKSSLFAKPDLDDMGTSGDHSQRAGAVPRSLFRKQNHREAHGADYGMPDERRPESGSPISPRVGEMSGRTEGGEKQGSYFRKNSLDEMTVGRTEKPAGKTPPKKPVPSSPLAGEGEERSAQQAKRSGESFRATNARSHSEGPAPREAQPSGSANLARGVASKGKRFSPLLEGQAERADDPKPVKRHRPGLGSYEDPADERQRNRRPRKTGRPGR